MVEYFLREFGWHYRVVLQGMTANAIQRLETWMHTCPTSGAVGRIVMAFVHETQVRAMCMCVCVCLKCV